MLSMKMSIAKIANKIPLSRVGGSAKTGLRIKELERLYGIEHGGNRKSSSNNYNLKTQKQLAGEMGISILRSKTTNC